LLNHHLSGPEKVGDQARNLKFIVVVKLARELQRFGVIASERSLGTTHCRFCPNAITSLAFVAGVVLF
jgi:hypothetical protein